MSFAERMKVPRSNIRQRDDAKDAEAGTLGCSTKGAEEPKNPVRKTVEMEDIRGLERDVEQVRARIDEKPAKRKRDAEDEGGREGEEGTFSRTAKRICRIAPAFLTGAAAAYVFLAYM